MIHMDKGILSTNNLMNLQFGDNFILLTKHDRKSNLIFHALITLMVILIITATSQSFLLL